MHPRNKHQGKYHFSELIKALPVLSKFITKTPGGEQSIDFSNPGAVKALNQAILLKDYQLKYWDIPAGYLCPPIPGRAEYIHLMADLLSETKPNLQDSQIRCLDIGTGANCIYPILGAVEYNWDFVGSEIDEKAIQNAREIITKNSRLEGKIEIRHQPNSRDIFRGIIQEGEVFQLMFCNPPFFESASDAEEATNRKLTNLHLNTEKRNFGGKNHELWCTGGEEKFINDLAFQSKFFKDQVHWFSTLVSKKENLKGLYKTLRKVKAVDIRTIKLDLGNKKSRIVAWTFQNPANQKV